MALPDMNTLLKQLLSRTIVVAGLSYFVLDGAIVPGDLMEHLKVGLTGGVGSVISACYVEPMLSA